jgi:hypothetical protein
VPLIETLEYRKMSVKVLSRPSPCRSTPITTTALLPFTMRLDAEGAVSVRLVA